MQQLPWQHAIDPSPTGTRWGNSLADLFGQRIDLRQAAPAQPPTLKSIGPMANMLAGLPSPAAPQQPSVSPLAAARPMDPAAPIQPQTLTPMRPVPSLSSYAPIAPQHADSATFQGRPAMTPGSLSYADNADTAGMNQQQATDFNVKSLESQIQAMRSLREAQNPGITQQSGNAGGSSIDLQDLARQANPFYQPGQGYGDEVLNRDRFMRQFADNHRGRAMRQQAEQGLAQFGSQRLNGLLDNALGQQQIRQAGQTALAQARQKALSEQQDYGLSLQRLGLDRAKFGLDARRAQAESEQSGIRDQYLNNLSAMQARKAALDTAGIEQKSALLRAYLDARGKDARGKTLQDLFAWHGRQPVESFGALQ